MTPTHNGHTERYDQDQADHQKEENLQMTDISITPTPPPRGHHEPTSATGASHEHRRRRALRNSALGLSALAMVGGGVLAAAPSAFGASSAPTHGLTTCAIAGDECANAISYANAHDGGGTTVLAVEADTEAHGGTVSHRVFDIRVQTNTGVYNLHVFRNDGPPYSDGVWWQNLAENQNPGGGSGSGGGSSTSSTSSAAPQISASQAATGAVDFVSGQGRQVLWVKHNQLKSEGQKDYYQVKLQLGANGGKAGTTNVWVDATSSSGIVTAASGSGLSYRDTNLVPASTAQANAVKATGGGLVYKTSLNGGKWRWYWVFVRNGSTKYKVGVDAVTGVVTQVHQN